MYMKIFGILELFLLDIYKQPDSVYWRAAKLLVEKMQLLVIKRKNQIFFQYKEVLWWFKKIKILWSTKCLCSLKVGLRIMDVEV